MNKLRINFILIFILLVQGCFESDEEFCIQHVGVDKNGSPYSYYTGSCLPEDINVVVKSEEVIIQFDNSFLERR